MWRDWLYRFVVGAWALVMRTLHGKLPAGVSFVPSSHQPSSQPQPSQDAQPSPDGVTNDARQQ
jgi:hypothetical protein